MLRDQEPKPCTCDTCKAMCTRPCWPSPEEATHLMRLGYASKFMLDYWQRRGLSYIEIVGPALKGYEGKDAPRYPTGRCTLQTEEGLCSIHDVCKPIEGRMATCDPEERSPANWHEDIAQMWDSPQGRTAVKLFKELNTSEV